MSLLIILGLTAMAASLVLIFVPWRWSAGMAFAGMVLVYSGAPGIATWKLPVFWGIAAALTIVLNHTLPAAVATSRAGNGYIAGGAVMGLAVGAIITPAWMVTGTCIGAILGALALSRTPAGRALEFPSAKFISYLCAKGLPAAVTLSIIGYGTLIAIENYAR